jgi:hypothetical protein
LIVVFAPIVFLAQFFEDNFDRFYVLIAWKAIANRVFVVHCEIVVTFGNNSLFVVAAYGFNFNDYCLEEIVISIAHCGQRNAFEFDIFFQIDQNPMIVAFLLI